MSPLKKTLAKYLLIITSSALLAYWLSHIKIHANLPALGYLQLDVTLKWLIDKATEWFAGGRLFLVGLLRQLRYFTPNTSFASDIIAYQAAIIAIAIPLSLEIIARVSERYKSGVITKIFRKQWQFSILLFMAVSSTLFCISLNFFLSESIATGLWKVVSWIGFILFIATNFVLLAFFQNLTRYATQTDFLIQQLSNDIDAVLKELKTKPRIRSRRSIRIQRELINSL